MKANILKFPNHDSRSVLFDSDRLTRGRYTVNSEECRDLLRTQEGKRQSRGAMDVLWTLIRLANQRGASQVLINYSSLRYECGFRNLTQESVKKYLQSLRAAEIISYQITRKSNYNSEKKLSIEIDFEKLNFLLSSGNEGNSTGKNLPELYTGHIEENNNKNISYLDIDIKDETVAKYHGPKLEEESGFSEKIISRKKKSKPLADYPDFTEDELTLIKEQSDRKYNDGAIRKIIAYLRNKYPDKCFSTRNHLISYAISFVNNEKVNESDLNKEDYLMLTKQQWEEEYRESAIEKQRYQSREKNRILRFSRTEATTEPFTKIGEYLRLPETNIDNNLTEEVKMTERQHSCDLTGKQLELNSIILQTFNKPEAETLLENCTLNLIAPDKIEVDLNGLDITGSVKDRLKICIRSVYGENTKIFSSRKVIKLNQRLDITQDFQPPVEKDPLKETDNTQGSILWRNLKKGLLDHLGIDYGNHALQAWFKDLIIKEYMTTRLLTATSSVFMIDELLSRYESILQQIADEYKFTIELHYDNNAQLKKVIAPKKRS